MLTAFITGLTVLLGNFLALFIISRYISRQKRQLVAVLRAYFETTSEQPSEFSNFIDIVGDRFSSKMAQNLKTVFMGVQSVDSKNLKKLDGALVTDLMAQSSPLLGTIAESFPAVGKMIRKNPNLIPLLQGLLTKKSSGNNQSEAAPFQMNFY